MLLCSHRELDATLMSCAIWFSSLLFLLPLKPHSALFDSFGVFLNVCSLWGGLVLCCISLNMVLQLRNLRFYFVIFLLLLFFLDFTEMFMVFYFLNSICTNRSWTFLANTLETFFGGSRFHGIRWPRWDKRNKSYSSISPPPQSSVISQRSFKCFLPWFVFSCLCVNWQKSVTSSTLLWKEVDYPQRNHRSGCQFTLQAV